MPMPPAVGVLARVAELLHEEPTDRGGALWRLSAEGRQLDANVIRMLPGTRVTGHVDPDLDVLLCVLGGSGRLEVDGSRQSLETGCVAWLPHGTRRALFMRRGRTGLRHGAPPSSGPRHPQCRAGGRGRSGVSAGPGLPRLRPPCRGDRCTLLQPLRQPTALVNLGLTVRQKTFFALWVSTTPAPSVSRGGRVPPVSVGNRTPYPHQEATS